MGLRVLDVGNCGRDHVMIRDFLTRHFDCAVDQAHDAGDALRQMGERAYQLVLVNRKLDVDYSDGIEVIRRLKEHQPTACVPVMLVTNYPEHQDAAVALGAHRGFGKLELDAPVARERVAAALGSERIEKSPANR